GGFAILWAGLNGIQDTTKLPGIWLIPMGTMSGSVALTLAFGILRYVDRRFVRAAAAWITILVAQLALGAALISRLPTDQPHLTATESAYLILPMAPCAIALLAIFDRALRNVLTCVALVAALLIPLFVLSWPDTSDPPLWWAILLSLAI